MEHVAALEPSSTGRRGSEPYDTWQRRSPPRQVGEVRGRGTRGSARARLDREPRSEAVGRVAVPKPISTDRLDSGLQDTWQHK
jgi:hypothetical protein